MWEAPESPHPGPVPLCQAYCGEEVDEAAITQAVHGLVAGDEDCEGAGPIQDGGQSTVLRGEQSSLGMPGPDPLPALLSCCCNQNLPHATLSEGSSEGVGV